MSTNKKGVKYMQMVDNLKQIVEYVCENFEDLDMDDPVEEG